MKHFLSRCASRSGRWAAATVVSVASMFVLAGTAAADTTVDRHDPFAVTLFNGCTGEYVLFQGFVHSKYTLGVSESGMIHGSDESNVESAQGVTLTGVRYVLIESSTDHKNFDMTDLAPVSITQESTLHFVRQGEDPTFPLGDDFYVHLSNHVTVNANGEVTSEFDTGEPECR